MKNVTFIDAELKLPKYRTSVEELKVILKCYVVVKLIPVSHECFIKRNF